ncbi:MAG: anaerobic glycerol-3-phosphate dehydrogenase subunit GlpA [Haloarculaceae archaeon]
MGYTPHVVVVGGGTTGVGTARDLAMRGLDVTLVERGALTNGATGGMHGLLHSGARYALSDPDSAADCLAENRVLREVAGQFIEDTGGLFVERPEDPDGHYEARLEACEEVAIPVEELTGAEAREREPGLSEEVERAFAVPDAGVDPFRLTAALARDAEGYGATVLTHAEVVDIRVENEAVRGVRVREHDPTTPGEPMPGDVVDIDADYVVNATGAWAGRLAELAGLEVPVRASKGAMVVAADRHVDTVVNRCRPRSQGDILVPHGDVSILGTTDVEVDDPQNYAREEWEVDLLFEELEPVVPALEDARSLRAYWGVRPLYDPSDDEAAAGGDTPGDGEPSEGDTGGLTRDFVLLDHEDRDGLWGLSTVVGGKLTTHRLMAEQVADHVCGKFGIDRPCRTDEIPVPGGGEADPEELATFDVDAVTLERIHERWGERATEVLDPRGPNPVVCPCRRVTRGEAAAAMDVEGVFETDLDAVRRRTGVGTGDCQGTRCAHRVAGLLRPDYDLEQVDRSLSAFYGERWAGQGHVLWGEQLSRAMGSYALHATTMNRDRPVEDPALDAFDSGPGSPDGDSTTPEEEAGENDERVSDSEAGDDGSGGAPA